VSIERIALSGLHIDPANVRKHPERNMATIKASLARFGPARSIVIDQNNVVRAGNGTVEAAIADGLTEAIVVNPKPGQVVAVRRKDWSDTEATAYSIADNRSAELAEWDDESLATTLEALQKDEFDLDAIGYEEGEIERLLAQIGDEVENPENEWEGMPEFEHDDKTAYKTIHVHFKDQESVNHFSELVGQKISEATTFIWHPKQEIIRYGNAS
jgi:ParB-like chromosome segregation protein Spo0J